MQDETYVQYGCGFSAPEGWRNFDASPTLALQRLPLIGIAARRVRKPFPRGVERGDVLRGLPVPQASCKGIYASHVIEHLALEDARTALRNTRSLLAPDGRFRVVVPDLRAYAQRYIDSEESSAALRFIDDTRMGLRSRPRSMLGRASASLSNAHHRWMWDESSLADELEKAGFGNVRPCTFGDSEDPQFKLVEDPGRFVEAVALECMLE